MKIALDYDKTYNLDPDFWDDFHDLCAAYGHEVRIVTARHIVKDNIDSKVDGMKVIYCNGVAKKHVTHHDHEYDVDIWIDDKPESILSNNPWTRQKLEEWRQSDDHKK